MAESAGINLGIYIISTNYKRVNTISISIGIPGGCMQARLSFLNRRYNFYYEDQSSRTVRLRRHLLHLLLLHKLYRCHM